MKHLEICVWTVSVWKGRAGILQVKYICYITFSVESRGNTVEDSSFIYNPSQIDGLVHSVTFLLRLALDDVAPLKKSVFIHRWSAFWFNSELHTLKENARKFEKKCCSTHPQDSILTCNAVYY